MKIAVNINGHVRKLDLSPVKFLGELRRGDEVIISHPETKNLCRALVESVDFNYVCFKEVCEDDAPWRWYLTSRRTRDTFYKINK